MTALSDAPRVVDVVILDEGETVVAKISVRMYLGNLRGAYRRNVRRGETEHAARCVEKFDRALDLYERLGGDPDQVPDIADEAAPE